MVKLKIDTSQFKKGFSSAIKELEDLAFDKLNAATTLLQAEAVKEAPSDTGNLRASIFSKTEKGKGKIIGRVGSISEYAVYVHQGTGIHAANGAGRKSPWKVVTLYKGKKVSFWTIGQKPNPFLTRARDKNIANIKRLLGVK